MPKSTGDLIAQYGIVGKMCRIVRGGVTVAGVVSGYVHISKENGLPGTPLGHTITLRNLTREGVVGEVAGNFFVVPPGTLWECAEGCYTAVLHGAEIRLCVQLAAVVVAEAA